MAANEGSQSQEMAVSAAIAAAIAASAVNTTASMDSSRVPVTSLNISHAIWRLYNQSWNDIDALYAGGKIIQMQADRFLLKRPKEIAEVFSIRLQRFDYENILGTAIGYYMAKLFQSDPEIDIKISGHAIECPVLADAETNTVASPGDPEYDFYCEGFMNDCDHAGTSLVDFFREVFRYVVLFKTAYILIDLPGTVQQASNLGDQDMRPNLALFDPRTALNWDTDKYGNLNWITFATTTHEHGFLLQPVEVKRWYYFDRVQFRTYELRPDDPGNTDATEITAKLIESGPHSMSDYANDDGTIGRVPVVKVEVSDGLWLAMRVMLQCLSHLNLQNSLDWGLLMSNLALPVIISDSEYEPTLSEGGYIHLSHGSTFAFAEPSGKSFEISKSRLCEIKDEIFRVMYLISQARSNSATAGAASGYSKEQDMAPAHDVLNSFGDTIRAAIQMVMYLVAAIRQDTTMDFDVRGLDFEHSPALEEIVAAQSLTQLDIQSDTFHKEWQKQVVRAYGKDWNPMLVETVCSEIQDAPTKSEIEQKQQDQQDAMFSAKLGGAQASDHGGQAQNDTKALRAGSTAAKADASVESEND